ncbi:hypothetical protein [Nocardia sp. NPDC059691]|uniref:hypothetical protein n=1 Tax=Nocardia sp. NPDC059691 TaxID=3346908 RepID=UPI0036B09E6A
MTVSPFPVVVAGLDSLDRLVEGLAQDAFADSPDHDFEDPSLEVLALAHDDDIHIGLPAGPALEGVGVTGMAAPYVRVDGRHDDTLGIRAVIVQAFQMRNMPTALRALVPVIAPIVTQTLAMGALPVLRAATDPGV